VTTTTTMMKRKVKTRENTENPRLEGQPQYGEAERYTPRGTVFLSLST
jgi:hypothetical protein